MAGAGMSKEQIKAKANKLANMIASDITKQIEVAVSTCNLNIFAQVVIDTSIRPSCKTTGKRWAYSSMVSNAEVFLKLFNFVEEKKSWKQKKISLNAFEAITGELTASV
ncbi:hypothetical protein MMC34_001895 [Xylographa carneopallida]|nr:hypothetical protein [Xylographa carneopallida]